MIERINLKDKEVILVGTAHISKESIFFVKETIEKEKPDVIGIELDSERFHQLTRPNEWHELDIIKAIKEGKAYLLLFNILLSSIQQKYGKQLDVKPGSEMLEAINIANSLNIPIILLDRNVKITLKRALNRMSFIEKIKLFFAIIHALFFGAEIEKERIEEMKKQDVISQLIDELSIALPSIKNVLVDERDIYIANKILSEKAKKILCVVGAGHLQGIKRFLLNPSNITLSELERIPKTRDYLKILKYSIPLIFFLIIIYAFTLKGILITLNILLVWVLAHSIPAAIGALVARANWRSILVAFVASPFTALHPAVAVGWFVGLMEAKLNKPKIKDFESLRQISSYSDLNKNRITHILLVTAYSNIGGTIGTIIALPYVLTLLV